MAYPNVDTMPIPAARKYHLYAPDAGSADKSGTCYFCGASQAAHYTMT